MLRAARCGDLPTSRARLKTEPSSAVPVEKPRREPGRRALAEKGAGQGPVPVARDERYGTRELVIFHHAQGSGPVAWLRESRCGPKEAVSLVEGLSCLSKSGLRKPC